ncbi:quinone oxidoreductase family protein [Actinoplanes sp. NPDC004185]
MRALMQHAVGGPEVLSVVDTEEPRPGAGQLLVRITAAGLNFHDVETRRRGDPGIRLPAIPGTDVVGVVEQVGRGAGGFTAGDRVVALTRYGGCAEYAVVPAQTAARLPDGVPDSQAAGVPTAGLTAWFLTRDLVPVDARAVVCHAAAGGVGLWLGTLLARRGVPAVGIVSTPVKARLASAAGYPHVVDRRTAPDLVRSVRRATHGFGATVVFDGVAGPRFAESFEFLHPGGTVVLFGRAAGAAELTRLPEVFLDVRRNLGLRTWFLGRALTLDGPAVAGALTELAALIAGGGTTMPVTELPLTDAARAYALLESGATTGKLVFRP